jgi:hypothetical protein
MFTKVWSHSVRAVQVKLPIASASLTPTKGLAHSWSPSTVPSLSLQLQEQCNTVHLTNPWLLVLGAAEHCLVHVLVCKSCQRVTA